MKKVILFLLMLFFVQKICAQENTKRLSFPQEYKITKAEVSNNNCFIWVYDKKAQKNTLQIYNSDLEKKFTIQSATSGFTDFFISEPYNSLIVIESGDEDIPDNICSYNLENGIKQWETETIAGNYELSSDKKKILLSVGIVPITVNIHDGSKNFLSDKFVNAQAKWFDKERIVLLQTKIIENPEYIAIIKKDAEERKEVSRKRYLLEDKYKKGLITSDEYSKEDRILYNRLSELSDLPEERKKEYPQLPPYLIPLPSMVNLYDTKSDFVEWEKELFTQNGQPFYFTQTEGGTDNIIIDKSNNILLLGTVQDGKEIHNCILKINDRGSLLWSNILQYTGNVGVGVTFIDDNIYYRFNTLKQGRYYFDSNKNIMMNDKAANLSEMPFDRIDEQLASKTQQLSEKLLFNKEKNELIFKVEGQ